ncbi:MAG: radical SAM protein [Firmicutes bacterium]|nr:radical SAM protein [Bacillota bacterium]
MAVGDLQAAEDLFPGLSKKTRLLVEEAWAARLAHFPMEIRWVYPQATEPVSLTASKCALDCAHCGGHYLEHMTPLEQALQMANAGQSTTGRIPAAPARSYLISGGCDRQGKVPVLPNIGQVAELSRRGRLNFHVGLVGDEEARVIGRYADSISFDFVGSDETIAEIYGLNRRVEDYVESYQALRRHARVIPHICIGLHGGEIRGEWRALSLLKELGTDGLALSSSPPTPGTRLALAPPPPVEEVAGILARARLDFPEIPISLGCMRPGGRYRSLVDSLAVRCGVNKIVIPARRAVAYAVQQGLTGSREDECCVL